MSENEDFKSSPQDESLDNIHEKFPELLSPLPEESSEPNLSDREDRKILPSESSHQSKAPAKSKALQKTLSSMQSDISTHTPAQSFKEPLPLRIVLIEDDSDYSLLIQWILAKSKRSAFQFNVQAFDTLEDGLGFLRRSEADLILLDLTLPDSQGIDTFLKVYGQIPEIPIVVLTSLNNDHLALDAVKKGAQDYLIKGDLNSNILLKAIQYAVERHRIHLALKAQALTDPLTRLYNRRGFLALAEQQYKLSRRSQTEFLIVFGDLDGLKQINDQFGHAEGDYAILKAAEILRKTFRESDIIARIGGDEFVILHVNAGENDSETLSQRLEENLKEFNDKSMRPYPISLSFGVTHFHPSGSSSLEDVLKEADKQLYQQKLQKKKSS